MLHDAKPLKRRRLWLRLGQLGLFILIAVFVFCAGVAFGNGRIRITDWGVQTENPSLPDSLDYTSVNQVYRSLKDNYDGKLTQAQLLDGLKAGLAEATHDPYTEYFTAAQAKDFNDQLNNSFTGVGAELGKDVDGNLIIVSPIAGFPASKAGLKPQDVIASINGESTGGMSLSVAVAKIRGPKGSDVTLKVLRDKTQALSFVITRDTIKIPSVMTKTLPGNIGYMQIITFADDTASLAQAAAQQFQKAHVKGVILDVRGNPGGLLNAAVDVSSLWLPADKTVVSERGTSGSDTLTATGNIVFQDMPTVVLIDDGSASASEITAGALHDNHLAYLIGTKSYGKGVVQQLVNLGDGSQLKVTVASWYRPNGQNINKKGITPDKVVSISDADVKAGNDIQLKAAEAYLAEKH